MFFMFLILNKYTKQHVVVCSEDGESKEQGGKTSTKRDSSAETCSGQDGLCCRLVEYNKIKYQCSKSQKSHFNDQRLSTVILRGSRRVSAQKK